MHRVLVVVGALGLTLLFFMVLPLMQSISGGPQADTMVTTVDVTDVPPPPPPPEEEPPKPEEPPQEPPELQEPMEQRLDLSQLELALNPGGFGDGSFGGDFAVKLNTVTASKAEDVDALFSLSDLDQQPRIVYQPGPTIDATIRRKAPGTVHIIFIVDQRGRVENPIVQQSTDPIFDKPALAAVRQWKFEPGKRQGQPVRFRMRVPITFPKD